MTISKDEIIFYLLEFLKLSSGGEYEMIQDKVFDLADKLDIDRTLLNKLWQNSELKVRINETMQYL